MSERNESEPMCAMCGKPIMLESAKTDERGNPVHEACYLQKVLDVNHKKS